MKTARSLGGVARIDRAGRRLALAVPRALL